MIPILQKLAPVGSCTPGTLKLLDFPLISGPNALRLGVAICYEDTDSAQIRKLSEMGAQALVFITNDSWFSHSQETVQHAWQATARAIETGLPVIRVGNSGVTGVVLPEGTARWLHESDGAELVDAQGSMVETVTCPTGSRRQTWYVRLGDAPLFVAFLLLITAMCVLKYYYEYEKRRYLP